MIEEREMKKNIKWLRKKVLELKNNGNADANQTETEAERERGRLQECTSFNCRNTYPKSRKQTLCKS